MGILDLFSLKGKSAYVTGAARGVGLGIATALAEAGAKVAVVDVDGAGAGKAAETLCRLGTDCVAIRADITRKDQVEGMVSELLTRWGRLDIAVNNAGIARNSPAEETSAEEWDTVIAVDLTSVFLCSQAAGKRMISQGAGSIVNIASMSARIVNFPQPQAAYNAAKAGVVQLTKSLAAEWAPRGVRVNCISPGYVNTDMLRPVPHMHPAWLERTPQRRFGEPWEIGAMAVYLASDASLYCTGSDLLIDGGYTLW